MSTKSVWFPGKIVYLILVNIILVNTKFQFRNPSKVVDSDNLRILIGDFVIFFKGHSNTELNYVNKWTMVQIWLMRLIFIPGKQEHVYPPVIGFILQTPLFLHGVDQHAALFTTAHVSPVNAGKHWHVKPSVTGFILQTPLFKHGFDVHAVERTWEQSGDVNAGKHLQV